MKFFFLLIYFSFKSLQDLWKIPNTVKLINAVCLLDGYSTALIGLEKKANLEENDMVLINVGLGGVGMAAVDLAANVFRAQVIFRLLGS